ncbi:MAG: rRNA maturation RNase YbeY [Clostridia bacterium]|jgi:metalloprotein, YbeY/UPF0054 family|nr:rRNA maturation RNase YbeY [Clostridia bacterium]
MGKLRVEFHGDGPERTKLLIRLAAKAAFASFDYPFDGEVCIELANDEKIREYNRDHRKIDRATDVLSFPLNDFYRGEPQEAYSGLLDPVSGRLPLGDMVISLERARAQAKEYGHSAARECAYLTVHSMLHLLGYDHVDEGQEKAAMREREEAVLSVMGLSRRVDDQN